MLACYSVSFCRFSRLFIDNMIGQAKISAFFQRKTSTGLGDSDTPTATPTHSEAKRKNSTPLCNEMEDIASANKRVATSAECRATNQTSINDKSTDLPPAGGITTSGLVTNVEPSWYKALKPEFSKPYFQKLEKFVEEERKKNTVYPPADQVFAWTRMTPIEDTKVVILGQDPYHGPSQAHGLCFSVQKGVALPPSLENMYKELATDIEGFASPGHGCLVGWAEQGVLLLNAVLTVRAHSANSHKDEGWETFTDAVIAWLNFHTNGTVFMLWGSYAHKKGAGINQSKHHVLQSVHPSPLSAYRGFFGCHHFSHCNELLRAQKKTPIDWSRFV